MTSTTRTAVMGNLVTIALEGARLQAILVAAIELGLAELIEQRPCSAEDLARRAGISPRGSQAIADGLVALRVWRVHDCVYENTPLSRRTLLPDGEEFVGSGRPELFRAWLPPLARLTEAVRDGGPALEDAELRSLWSLLTPSLARNGRRIAARALELLDLEGTPRMLDLGGGAEGFFGEAFLRAFPESTAVQVDWPEINRSATTRMRKLGLGQRFATIDGDLRVVPLEAEPLYDVVVPSQVLHLEDPAGVGSLLARVFELLRPEGTLVISEWLVEDGRTGPAGPLVFNATMVLLTEGGRSYTRGEIGEALIGAGFEAPAFHRTETALTLVLARRGRAGPDQAEIEQPKIRR